MRAIGNKCGLDNAVIRAKDGAIAQWEGIRNFRGTFVGQFPRKYHTQKNRRKETRLCSMKLSKYEC
jgi:hypothetical protein